MIPIRRTPMEIPNQIGNKVFQMKQSQIRSCANPSSCTKWYHLYPFASTYIKITILHEPLWLELQRIIPHRWIKINLSHQEIDEGTFWNRKPLHLYLFCGPMGEHEMPRWVSSKTFQNHRSQISHLLQILFVYNRFWFNSRWRRWRWGSDDGNNFIIELPLNVGMFHEIRHDPFDLIDSMLVKLLSKAHDHQQAKHGVEKMVIHLDSGSLLLILESTNQDSEDPLARPTV
ncbi:hypothetical protein LXL04_011059 [Taraxacum kok-saghyz]